MTDNEIISIFKSPQPYSAPTSSRKRTPKKQKLEELREALRVSLQNCEDGDEEFDIVEALEKAKEHVYKARRGKTVKQLQNEGRVLHQKLSNYYNKPITVVNPSTGEKEIVEPEK